MTEIIQIAYSVFFLTIFFLFPLNKYFLNFLTNNKEFNNTDAIAINFIIHLFFFFLISFFKINFYFYGYTIFTISIIINIFLIKKNFNLNKISLLDIISAITLFGIVIQIALTNRLEWDGLAHWFYKVQIFYQNGSVLDLKEVPLPSYPHLGSFVWAFFWKISYLKYEYLGRFFYIFIYLVSILSLAKLLKDSLYSLIFFIAVSTLTLDFYLFGGYQEYLLFSILSIFARFFFFTYKKDKRKNYLYIILFNLICFILPWVKQEGEFYALFLFFLVIFKKEFTKKNKLLFSLVFILSITSWYIIESYIKGHIAYQLPLNRDNYLSRYKDVIIIIQTFAYITLHIFKVMIRYPVWILIVIFSFLYFKKNNFNENIKLIIFFFVMNYGLIYAIYFWIPVDFIFSLQTSLFRLMLHTTGFYSVILIILFKKILKEK
jgi:hypothetical protein